jgi:transposase-like protein
MELVETKRSGIQRSKEEIISLMEECRKSKLSVKEFAKLKGIHEATYYNWRNKYGGKQRKPKVQSGFATLKINPSPAAHTAALFAEVKGIKIYHAVPASYLKELL